jgi:hypothetical protein
MNIIIKNIMYDLNKYEILFILSIQYLFRNTILFSLKFFQEKYLLLELLKVNVIDFLYLS